MQVVPQQKRGHKLLFRTALFLLFLIAHSAHAQLDTATLSGRVLDTSGASVSMATLELTDVERGTKRVAFTNDIGFYVFSIVRPGHYRVWVSAPGFRAVELTNLTIYTQDDIQELFVLASGSPLDSVSLKAAGVHIATSGAVGTVIDPSLISNLPLNGLSFQKLFQLTPGFVTATTSFASQGQFSANGQRTNTNYFAIDGVDADVGIAAGVAPGQSAVGSLPAVTAFGGTNSLISTEDVQEFAILTSSYAPEFGHLPGAQISIVSRSGTREFHGCLFEYLRNDALDASDWFSNRARLPRTALRQNDFGGILGGSLFKKTFFFASVEGLALDQPAFAQDLVPAVSARSLAPVALKPFLNAYPLPNGPDFGNGLAQATYSFSNPSALNAESLRLDYHLAQRIALFARYVHSTSEIQERGAESNTLSTTTGTDFSLQTITAGLNYSASHLITDLRFNWSRSSAGSFETSDTFGGAVPLSPQLLFPSGFSQQNGFFQFLPALGSQNLTLAVGKNVFNIQRQIEAVGNVSHQFGVHVLKAGLDVRTIAPHIQPAGYEQQAAFPDIQSALRGLGLLAIESNVSVNAYIRNYSAYIENTWRPRTRITLGYGVRWDYAPAPVVRGAGLQPASAADFQHLPTLSLAVGSPLYRSRWNNFAPRTGAAYAIRNEPGSETVLRLGGGIFYDLSSGGNAVSGIVSPFTAQKFLNNAPFPLSARDASPPPIGFNSPFSVQAYSVALRTPYIYQWNLAMEQALGKAQSVTVTALGAFGHSLLRNQKYVGGVAGVPSTFKEIFLTDNSGYSHYESLQIKFQRRVAKNSTVLAGYSYSHSLDDVSTDTLTNALPSHFIDPARDYGPSDFDIRHTASVAVSYGPHLEGYVPARIKGIVSGWSIGSILLARSAPPVDVTVLRSIGDLYNFRPDLLRGPPLYLDDLTAPGGKRINPAAFEVPSGSQQGNLGRNFLRGFPLIQCDLAASKIFQLTRELALLARIEAFNVFNHPNFAPPNGLLGVVDSTNHFISQSSFGISQVMLAQGLQTGAFGSGFSPLYQLGGARNIQIALKLNF